MPKPQFVKYRHEEDAFMNIDAEVLRGIEAAGQQEVLRFGDELDEAGRRKLAGQLAAINWRELPGLIRDYVVNKKSGKVTVTKKDGTTETLDCKNGTCTTSSGTAITAADCEACTSCTDSTCAPAASCSGGSCTDTK